VVIVLQKLRYIVVSGLKTFSIILKAAASLLYI